MLLELCLISINVGSTPSPHVNSYVSMSKVYATNDKRYNYTTPKSFLEMLNLYLKVLKEKDDDLVHKIVRLENGLEKLKTLLVPIICTIKLRPFLF